MMIARLVDELLAVSEVMVSLCRNEDWNALEVQEQKQRHIVEQLKSYSLGELSPHQKTIERILSLNNKIIASTQTHKEQHSQALIALKHNRKKAKGYELG